MVDYLPQTWINAPSTLTPVSATRLGYMETGIQSAQARAESARHAINVTSSPYSADKTGLTDSTVAIGNAITAGITQGRPIYAPKGTYKTTFQGSDTTDSTMKWMWKPSAAFEFFGDGDGTVITTTDTSSTPFWLENIDGGYIHDIRLLGSGVTSPHRSTSIRLKNSDKWKIERVTAEDWGSHNMHLHDGASHNQILRCVLKNSIAWNGVEIKDGCTYNTVAFCDIDDGNDQGVEIRNSSDNLIAWNLITNSGLGAPSGPNSGVGLENGSHRNGVLGNWIINSRVSAVQILMNCNDNWVERNLCDTNTTTADLIGVLSDQAAADAVVDLVNRNRIERNTIRNGLRDGILNRAGLDTKIIGNKVTACARYGINVESFQYTVSGVTSRYKPLRAVVDYNEVWGVPDIGITATYADDAWIRNNSVWATTNADPVTNAKDAIFVQNALRVGVRENFTASYRYGVRGNTLTDYHISTNNGFGNITAQTLIDSSSGTW